MAEDKLGDEMLCRAGSFCQKVAWDGKLWKAIDVLRREARCLPIRGGRKCR